ncbi:MAG: gliding motility-associated C-terminal domain-containing protein, partial [Bacteroidales bacterium]
EFIAAGGSASDNCGIDEGSFMLLSETSTPGNCPRIYTRTYQIADLCGNTATCTQEITVNDAELPVITCPPALTAVCSIDEHPVYLTYAEFIAAGGSASDNCGIDEGSFVLLSETSTPGNCPKIYTRTYQIADLCGNTSTCEQAITVVDVEFPVMICPGDVTALCDISEYPPYDDFTSFVAAGGSATDNCGIDESSFVLLDEQIIGAYPAAYSIIRTYGISDLCGNQSVCEQTINLPALLLVGITPENPIICADEQLELNGNPSGGNGAYSHEWSGTGAIYLNQTNIQTPVFSNAPGGSYTLIYTVTDESECIASDMIMVIVEDPTLPVFDPIGPFCVNAIPPALPLISNNNITGSWVPSVIDTSIPGISTYTFTPDEGQCALVANIEIEIAEEIAPIFNPIGPLCLFSDPPALPAVSINGITGSWVPPVIDTSIPGISTYTFTPDTGQCALEVIMEIEITDEIIPEFDSIGPLCQHSTPPALPAISLNGITGNWNPPTINTAFPGTFQYTFTPDNPDQCAVQVTIEIIILPEVIPAFDPIGPFCQYSTPPVLPGISLNGITGTWMPPIINTTEPGSFQYTFTPDDPDQCFVPVVINITILPELVPTFYPIGPLCQYAVPPTLPITSINGITGSWVPSVINTSVPGTTTYTFTPNPGQCAASVTMDIIIEEETSPEFNPIGPLCLYSEPPDLPAISDNGISGSWEPPVINTSVPGISTYTFTPDEGLCAVPVVMEIEITDEIIPAFDPIGPLCQYSFSPALPDTSLNGITGTWNPSTINTTVPGTFQFIFTPDDPDQCAVQATLEIIIEPEIIPVFDPIDPLCQHSMPPVLPNISMNSIIGIWSPPTINTDTPGTFQYTFIPDDTYPCAVDMTIEITIDPEVIPEFDPVSPMCQYSITPVLSTTSDNGITGVWDPSGIDTSVPGTVTCTFTPDEGQCAIGMTMIIEIYPLPDIFAGDDQSVPYGTCVTIGDATASGAEPLNFSWAPADLLVDANVLNPTTINLQAGTTFYLTVTDANGCINSDEVNIDLYTIIPETLEALTGPGSHCLGNSVIIPIEVSQFSSVASFQLKLNFNKDNLLCDGIINENSYLADELSGWVDQQTGEIILQWECPEPVSFSQPETIAELVFNLINPGSGELKWYTNPMQSYFINQTGNYVPAEFFAGEITIYEPPVIYLPDSIVIYEGQTVAIFASVNASNPPINLQWIYPDGNIYTIDPYFTSITVEDAGLYTLLAIDKLGCADLKTVHLVVLEKEEEIPTIQLFIPNAFTPDGDGLNDTFRAVPSNDIITEFKMLIYNRWGEKLWESDDISVGWDGTKNGILCPGDVYAYKIIWKAAGVPGADTEQVAAGVVLLLQ